MKILLCPLASPSFAFPVIAIGRALAPLARSAGLPVLPSEASSTRRWHQAEVVARQLRDLEGALSHLQPHVLLRACEAIPGPGPQCGQQAHCVGPPPREPRRFLKAGRTKTRSTHRALGRPEPPNLQHAVMGAATLATSPRFKQGRGT